MDNKPSQPFTDNTEAPREDKKSDTQNMSINYYLIAFFIVAIGGGLSYSYGSKTKKPYSREYRHLKNRVENTAISNTGYTFGIDVSHYQGKINWGKVKTSSHPIEYVFIRATMGKNRKDHQFLQNWKSAKKHNYVRGAYHYYRPSENSTKQFNNFKSVVKLETGDFIPILDIEKESVFGRKNLRKGILNWLKLAEETYGVKPMIYTGLSFYNHVLKGYVDNYPIWIAAYSGKHRVKNTDWMFHQFTEKVIIKGINEYVDGNDFNGTLEDLKKITLK